MNDDAVLTRREGAVGVMTFNRPERLNTLDMPMMLVLEAALGVLEADAQVRVIVITGADDRAFMAGGDIKDLSTRRPTSWYDEFGKTVHRVFRRFETCDKPTLAAVNGWALGGGMDNAMSAARSMGSCTRGSIKIAVVFILLSAL